MSEPHMVTSCEIKSNWLVLALQIHALIRTGTISRNVPLMEKSLLVHVADGIPIHQI